MQHTNEMFILVLHYTGNTESSFLDKAPYISYKLITKWYSPAFIDPRNYGFESFSLLWWNEAMWYQRTWENQLVPNHYQSMLTLCQLDHRNENIKEFKQYTVI